jgi:hypothetical protein
MIQRIQTIFLFLTVVAQGVFLRAPLSRFFMENDMAINFFASGFKNAKNGDVVLATYAILLLACAILVLSIITIFLYKKRILQIRFCIYNILLNVGMIGMLIMQISAFLKNNEVSAHSYTPVLVIPIATIILLYLAFRGIRKDEVLVKAYERLR